MDDTRKLAQIGTKGQYPGNCRRDLLAVSLPRGVACKAVAAQEVPIVKLGRILLSSQAVLSPIQIVEMMCKDYRFIFSDVFGLGCLERFWQQIDPNDPKLIDHPMLRLPDWQKRAIPIMVHGDGASFTSDSKNSLMVTSWRPLLNEHFDFGTFLLFVLPRVVKASGHKHGVDSHWEMWSLVVHFFNCMFEGRHPDRDHRGRAWPHNSREASSSGNIKAGGHFFVVWNLVGDLPYLAEEYGLPHFNSGSFCWMCGVNRDDLPYTDCRRAAMWRGALTPWGVGKAATPSEHPIWNLQGVSRWFAPGDLMHTGCLGVLAWLLGSVCYELIFDGIFPGPLELRRSRLWDLVQLKYDAKGVPHSSRLHDLELDRFRHTNAFAELRAKAAVTRHFLPILADVCRDLSTGSARDLHRQATLDNIVAVYDIIVHSEYRIVGFQHRRLMKHADAFLVHIHG